MLEFKEVSFRYPIDEIAMIQRLSFHVEDGAFVSIIGASGCGKSTLFRLINGLEHGDEGQITVDGVDIAGKKNYSAFMPQKDMLFPWYGLERNICLPMEIAKVPKKEQAERLDQVLEQVGLTAHRKKFPHELSGGMKQRAAFARTLLSGADMLLLDEPFSALDYLTRVDMQEWLMEQWLHYQNTILFITHDVEEAIFLSKRIYVISENPITSMEEITVPLAYPRVREDLKRPDMVALKESLIETLRKGVMV